jgi:RiboL-PSP-HEPN
MPSTAKQTPLEVFEDNIDDANQLLALARILANARSRAMRRERRERLGDALGLPKSRWDEIDGVESSDLFIVLKPGAGITRARFTEEEMRPLLRQAVVAIAAAVETYVADKAGLFVGEALKEPTSQMKRLSIDLGEVLKIDERYQRRRWGYRDHVLDHIRRSASSAPNKVGGIFSFVGMPLDWAGLDKARKVPKGSTGDELLRLCQRRNKIAHEADRTGGRQARVTIAEVEVFMTSARSVVEAIDQQLAARARKAPAQGRALSATAG